MAAIEKDKCNKKKSKIDLEKGNVIKIFFYYAIPAILGMLAMTSAGIIDGIFVGQLVGSDALAAINLSMPVFNILYGIGIMIAMGGATLANIKRGEKNLKESNNLYSITITLIISMAAVSTILGVFFSDSIAKSLGAAQDTHLLVSTYIRVISIFLIPYMANATLDMFIRNDGFPIFPIVCTISGSVINIVLDYIFVGKLKMGIGGAALATGISQVIPTIAMTIFIILKSSWHFKIPIFKFKVVRDMMFNGSSELLSNISVGISGLIFNIIIMKSIGTNGVAAFSVANYAAWIAVAIFFGIASAINPGVSYNKGSGNIKRIMAFRKIGTIAAIVLGIVLCSMLLIFGDTIVYMFVSEKGEVHNLAVHIIRFYAFSMLLTGVNIVSAMYYTAINEPLISAVIAGTRSLIGLILGLLILPIVLGSDGIWSSIIFAELLTIIIVIYYRKKKPY